jgi:hypothetical protein
LQGNEAAEKAAAAAKAKAAAGRALGGVKRIQEEARARQVSFHVLAG